MRISVILKFNAADLLTNFVLPSVYAVTVISVIMAVAFFTVLERKVLAAVQRRRGPNMLGIWGLLQALADGLKLLMKEPLFVSGANYYIFLLSPMFLLAMSLSIWSLVPLPGYSYPVTSAYSFVIIFLFSGLNSFAIILAGLASNSRYSLIGGVRAIAQLISYEIPMSLSILTISCLEGSFNLHNFSGSRVFLFALALPSLIIFFISLLAETNRTPFDLPEAEAELVAGYNLEYSSILFSLFFLAEYSNILIASSLLSIVFFSGMYFYFSVIFFSVAIILVRAILPRYTFAQLINLCWCVLLPASIFMLMLVTVLMFIVSGYPTDFVRPELADFVGLLSEEAGVFEPWAYSLTPLLLVSASGETGQDLWGTGGWGFFTFFVIAFLVVSLLVGLNWVLINFNPNNRKNSPYECGFEPVGSPISDFSPNFMAVGLIFLIYDVEVLLSYPWAYSMSGKSAFAVAVFLIFNITMLVGLVYEVLDESFKIV